MKTLYRVLAIAIVLSSLSAALINEAFIQRGYFAVGGEWILILLIIYGGVHALSKDFKRKIKTKRG